MKRGPTAGPERYVLGLALLLPLAFMLWLIGQVPGVSLAAPTTLIQTEFDRAQIPRRPQPSNAAPPPTLAPPTPTARPTATPVALARAPAPTATPAKGRTYVVQKGDELKHIAADYGVSIWKIIDSNDIPDPDSLRIGQVLQIPDN